MSATRSSAALALLVAFAGGMAHAQAARFDWLADIERELPAIEACATALGAGPAGVAALHREGAARHLLLRDAGSLVWACDWRADRVRVSLEPDPASVRHRRPVFWLARFGEPWAECWDAEPVRKRDGSLAGWFVVQTC